ncbi:MAG: hypothetical protein QOH47_2408 [Sphingomonadales bacterium]|jgi:hypothetical protein|nr:hypothetical protein [Sphingomonadales bacterium]
MVITSTTKRDFYYLGESAAANIINEEIIIVSGAGKLGPGTVLGQITEGGTQTVAAAVAFAGNSGTGTVGSLTADAGANPGAYKIEITEPAANAGTFRVEKPDGSLDGTGTVGVAYNGTINFTISDATDFVAGDGFTVTVSYATSNKYALHDAAGVDGREAATAILGVGVDATDADVTTVATVRGPATIFGTCLTFKSGISDANKAAAIQALRNKGLAVIPQHAS